MQLHNLRLEVFCHETEDERKIREALLFLLPAELVERDDFSVDVSENRGSWGNRIALLSIELKKQKEIQTALDRICVLMGEDVRRDLLTHLGDHVTENCTLIIRFSKQNALNGLLSLDSKDCIQLRARIASFPAKKELAEGVVKHMLACQK
jgi:RNA-binding protein